MNNGQQSTMAGMRAALVMIMGILTGASSIAGEVWAGDGDLVIYQNLQDFLDMTDGVELHFDAIESGSGQIGVFACALPVNRHIGAFYTTTNVNACLNPGELIDGFSLRSEDGGVLLLTAPQVFGGTTHVLGAQPGTVATLLSFHQEVTAVAMDVYNWSNGQPVELEVFAADGSLIDSFIVAPDPPAPGTPAFAGMTSDTPIARIDLRATVPGGVGAIGNLYFGGVPGVLAAVDSLDFGVVEVGDSVTQALTLRNDGHSSVTVPSLPEPGGGFSIATDECAGSTLQPHQECTVQVSFAPAYEHLAAATLAFGDSTDDVEVTLRARAVAPLPLLLPGTLDFGAVEVGAAGAEAAVSLFNPTALPVEILSITAPEVPFTIIGDDCDPAPFVLQPGESCAWTIAFDPDTSGVADSRIWIDTSAPTSPHVLTVTGHGGHLDDVIFHSRFEAGAGEEQP